MIAAALASGLAAALASGVASGLAAGPALGPGSGAFDPWLLLRFGKLIGVLAFAMGIAVALWGGTPRVRQRAAYGLATSGFLLTALAGFGLARATGASLGAPWISASLLLSLLTLDLTVRSVEPGRAPSGLRTAGILASLAITLALMVWRPGAP